MSQSPSDDAGEGPAQPARSGAGCTEVCSTPASSPLSQEPARQLPVEAENVVAQAEEDSAELEEGVRQRLGEICAAVREQLFHYALRPGGFLFLGPSEGATGGPELFEAVDKKSRIFRRKEPMSGAGLESPMVIARGPERLAASVVSPEVPSVSRKVRAQPGEELQAVNGELETTNARLEQKLRELATAHADLQNLFASGKRTEQALRESEERLRIFVEHAPASLAMFDRKMRYLRASRRWLLDFKLGDRDLRGLSHYEVFPELTEEWRAVHQRALAGEVIRHESDRLVRADGTVHWLRREVRPWRDESGGVGGIVIFSEDITAIVVAAEEARQSAELLRLAQEAAQVGTWFWDTQTGEKFWSDELWSLFGLEKEGRSASDELLAQVLVPEDLPSSQRAMAEAVTEGKDLRIEYRVRRNGEPRHLLARGKALRNGAGAVTRVLGITIDITDQKKSEVELRRLSEQRQLALDAARMGWQHFDVATQLMKFDERFGEILGLSGRQCGWPEIIQVIHPDEVARVEAEVKKALDPENPRPYSVEHRVVRPDGTIRWVEAHGQALLEDCAGGRRVTGYVGTVADITDRKQIQQWSERTNRGLGRLAGASLAVMAETAPEPMLRVVAEAALALTEAKGAVCGHGYLAGQFAYTGSARAPGAPPCPPGNLFQLQNGGVHTALCGDAESIRLTDAELRAHPRWWGLPPGHTDLRGLLGIRMTGPGGVTSGVILVTDKAKGDFNEEDEALLKQLGMVASLALHHVEARLSLEEADRRKNEFLAMLSHELRNPLAPIRNSLYVLERAAPGGEQARRAQEVIDRQVAHMTRLVDDLLDVTRISRGKIQLHREPLELGENVRRAVEDHRSGFTSRGIELEVSVPQDPIPVEGDRTRVAQVIGNLLNNAAKFTPGGGRVRVLVDLDPARSDAARVRVRDTGAGITPEMMPRLFEPFTQADATLDRSQGGLGLGLALVKGLVELHGGTVGAASDGPGQGTEFTIRLPLRRGPAPVLRGAGSQGAEERATRRVLVIEDNADAASSLQEVLELGNNAVAVAYTGLEGLEKARAFGPDIVFCDIGLPGMDGYQIAQAMRADPDLRSLVLVALTGYAGPEDVSRSREAGFDFHLAKPASLERVEQIVAGGPGAGARLRSDR